MPEPKVAPKSSTDPARPPQDLTWSAKNPNQMVKMRKQVIDAIAKEATLARNNDAQRIRVAMESVKPGNEKAAAILKMSAEAQARLISRLIQTQLMGEFLTLGREQVNWRNLVDKAESDPLVMAAADIMADHVAGPGIYVTADNAFAKARVEDFFEKVGGPETGGIESMVRELARNIHLYGLGIWTKYKNPFTKQLIDLREVPLESIYRIHRDDKGNWVTMHQMPEYYGEPVEARRLVVFKWRALNSNAFGAGIAQVMYISRRYTLTIRDNISGSTLSSRTIIVPSQFDGRTMLYDIILKVFQRYGMPYQALVVGDKDQPADQNIVENLVKPAFKRREEIALNRPLKIIGDEIDPRTRFEAYMNEVANLNIVTLQTPIIKLWAAPEGMTEASARTALKAFDRIVLSRQRFIKRIIEREVIPEFLRGEGIDPSVANVRLHFGPIDKPELSYQDIVSIFNLNSIAIQIANIENPAPMMAAPQGPKKPGDKGEAFPQSNTPQLIPAPVPRKIRLVMTVGELRQNLRRYGFDLEEQMQDEEKAEPAPSLGRSSNDGL